MSFPNHFHDYWPYALNWVEKHWNLHTQKKWRLKIAVRTRVEGERLIREYLQ